MDGSEARDTFFISVRFMCRKGDILLAGKAPTNASSRVFAFISSAICVVCYLADIIVLKNIFNIRDIKKDGDILVAICRLNSWLIFENSFLFCI
jgi:hypothetical protein